MVPEVVERAFDPFFSTKERGKGTGLGLAMVYGFARQSNGAAVIDSLVGSGTTVQLLLPVAVGRYPIDSAAPVGASSPAVARGERVLVVDDEVDLRRIVRDYLAAAGYDVTMAGSPAEALSLLETATFELLISDIVMPGDMDGADLARVAAGRYPEMRILLISGYADDVVARIPGQCRLLEKPFRQHDLQQAVRAMLDERTGESD
jgi:CheY-like chemotaxis protein